ncbi:eukaryotic translation initiation factor 5A-2 [Iris pallida]|uniref:Eukaryotic translation initiation factor 5A-2 n=1 Tax=Iris pallida TaxID=29817 RepID=A0AAX6FFC2_IRIPA|nr:eukaryotic translation initiation factor 5A-2 [Iris pallida]
MDTSSSRTARARFWMLSQSRLGSLVVISTALLVLIFSPERSFKLSCPPPFAVMFPMLNAVIIS